MPKHSAPGHPDCWINCPGGGYAIYIKPHGPCERGCDDPGAALKEILGDNAQITLSFRIMLFGKKRFKRLCQQLLDIKLLASDVSRIERAIGAIPELKANKLRRFLSSHENVTISALIQDVSDIAEPEPDPTNNPGGGGPSGGPQSGPDDHDDTDYATASIAEGFAVAAMAR